EAIQSVPKILQSGIIPLAIEYVERDLVERSAKKLGLRWPCDEGKTFLIIILAEFDQDTG
ncbi:MAG: FAD-binding oxidoreductase, partial [Thermoprotei archaeon]